MKSTVSKFTGGKLCRREVTIFKTTVSKRQFQNDSLQNKLSPASVMAYPVCVRPVLNMFHYLPGVS